MPHSKLNSGKGTNIIELGDSEPAIVFLAGLGDPADWWFTVPTPEKARPHWNSHPTSPAGSAGLVRSLVSLARVIVYDRAGVGGSTAPDHDRTWQELYTELERVIESSQLGVPPVLVGHSLGGLLAYTYARRHQHQLSGLVLLDPTPPPLQPRPHGSSPERLALTHFDASELAEHALADLPLLLVAPGRAAHVTEVADKASGEELEARFRWRHEQQERMLATSARSQSVWLDEPGHYVHLDSPEIVRTAVLSAWKMVRTDQHLLP